MIIIEEGEVGAARGRPEAGGPARGPKRATRRAILLVEDNDADRDVYGGLLWYNGFDVYHAADGETAVARALELQPDLILLDVRLPGALNGLDVVRRLTRAGLDAPVIFLSACPREELDQREIGTAQYLEKPIDPFVVLKEVVRTIGYARPDGG